MAERRKSSVAYSAIEVVAPTLSNMGDGYIKAASAGPRWENNSRFRCPRGRRIASPLDHACRISIGLRAIVIRESSCELRS